jgi:hypothetical protein
MQRINWVVTVSKVVSLYGLHLEQAMAHTVKDGATIVGK